MGVSSFFKWLTDKYPRILSPCLVEEPVVIDGAATEIDLSGPNPNGYEFDNLYIDMNGLVHPCCHPEGGKPQPKDETEMIERVFEAVDEVVRAVRPRKLLFLAFDGVAPRAKMNQQRGRRFKSARDRILKEQVTQPPHPPQLLGVAEQAAPVFQIRYIPIFFLVVSTVSPFFFHVSPMYPNTCTMYPQCILYLNAHSIALCRSMQQGSLANMCPMFRGSALDVF